MAPEPDSADSLKSVDTSRSTNPSPSFVEQLRRFPAGFVHLFFRRKFGVHRTLGLAYLMQYAAIIVLFFADYEKFRGSPLIITLPLTGVVQTITAIYTFTFLPKNQADPGYYSDKSTMSYPFIKENIFFTSLLCFQWLYYNDRVYPLMKGPLWPIEYLFTFLPYCFRFMTAKTRIRDSLNTLKNKSDKNRSFYFYLTWLTKLFYIWAKHYIGFFLNYLRFVDLATPSDIYWVHLLLIGACFATTISMFLHTLRFKKYLDPRVSFSIYVVSYLSTFVGYAGIFPTFFYFPPLFAIVFVGLVLNMLSNTAFNVYQIGVMFAFHFGLVQPWIV